MSIYTKTGDAGKTGLFDGTRVDKDDVRVAAYGEVDELCSVIGLLGACEIPDDRRDALLDIQRDLFEIGADLATPGSEKCRSFVQDRIRELEAWIDEIMDRLPPLRSFILPGGCTEAGFAHLARTVCRRAERTCWHAQKSVSFPQEILVYLNRLSDLLFALARDLNDVRGVDDIAWTPRKS